MWTRLTNELVAEFVRVLEGCEPIAGLTHGFYKYPARFSHLFARTAIKTLTEPGELVLDPFMGGGTTLVEARALGRRAIGVDISELATFVARVKTTPLPENDLSEIQEWAKRVVNDMNLRRRPIRPHKWIEDGYQQNINTRECWPIRKSLELALGCIEQLRERRQQEFARCVLLKTAQWALDCRRRIPSASAFRVRFYANVEAMCKGVKEFSECTEAADRATGLEEPLWALCLNQSAIGIEHVFDVVNYSPPSLILTSPPYPGVHVLYHRWQVQGRKETPAPFWIANCLDGNGASYYTLGGREQKGLTVYFKQIRDAFASLAQIANDATLLVQIVAFPDLSWQLPKYLSIMEQVGFREVFLPYHDNLLECRLWRRVPNRKWYAQHSRAIASSREVVLFHQLS